MNCSVCGGPLLFDRVVFRCSCGTYIHAYCGDKHILQAHRPVFEEGRVDLNGEFHLKNEPEAVAPVLAPITAPQEEEEAPEGVALPPDEDVRLEEQDEGEEESPEPGDHETVDEEKADDISGEGR